MKNLVIGYIPDNYSPDTYLVLGPWSFFKNQKLLYNDATFEPDPYQSVNELKSDAIQAESLTKYLLRICVKKLNILNNTNYSTNFWRVLIMPWLSTLVQITIERHRRISNLLEKYPDQSFSVELVGHKNNWKFFNTLDFIYAGVLNVYFNEWLFEKIIKHHPKKERFHITYIDRNVPNQGKRRKIDILLHLKNIKNKLINIFPVSSVYGIKFIEAPVWELLLKIISLRKKDYIPKIINSNNHSFDQLDKVLNIVDFESLIDETIPKVFQKIPMKLKSIKPRRLLIGPKNLFYNEVNKLKIARHAEAGSKIIGSQHGSMYGTTNINPFLASVEYVYDGFITWGWENHSEYKCKTIPLSSPHFNKRVWFKENSILLIGTHSPLFNYRICSVPQPADIIDGAKQLAIFISFLNKKSKSNLVYRPYLDNHLCFNTKKFISSIYKNINIEKRSIKRRLYKAKLVVIDNPGTVLHQRMARNLPTLAFWNENMWGLSKQAEPYFKALREAGILFHNERDAAMKVNEIWNNLSGWWEQPHIQKAREEWSWQYARYSKHWRWEWIKALWKL